MPEYIKAVVGWRLGRHCVLYQKQTAAVLQHGDKNMLMHIDVNGNLGL